MIPTISLLCAVLGLASAQKFESVYEWNLVKYNTPPLYPGNDTFKPERTIITSLEVGFDRVFMAVPKIWSDNPATLVWVPKNIDDKSVGTSPAYEAYPSWDWHVGGITGQPITEYTCSGMINVFRIRVDKCGRLWALDCGILDSYTDPKPICPPKILAFDMNTHKVVKRIEIPKDVLLANSLLSNFAIDDTDESGEQVPGNCDVGHLYISDIAAPAVIVYDVKTEQVWRHSHPNMYPHPDFAKFTVEGDSFVLMDGIIGTALSNPGPNREFFWHAMSANAIFSVPTAALKEPPSETEEVELPVRKMGDKSSQAIPLAYDPVEEALVFSPATETAVVSWKPNSKVYSILAYDPVTLQWVTEIRPTLFDNNNLWVVSTRLQKYEHNTVNPAEINQRVFRYSRGIKLDAQQPLPLPYYGPGPALFQNPSALPPLPAIPAIPAFPVLPGIPLPATWSRKLPGDFPLQNHLAVPLRANRQVNKEEEEERSLGLSRYAS